MTAQQIRHKSSNAWTTRATTDRFAREAKVQGFKSRAAFKLLEIDQKYKIFSPGQTVLDLGYAPGSWSQVAITMTRPGGRVLGVDVIPAMPPKGVSTLQGDFTLQSTREEIERFLSDRDRGRARSRDLLVADDEALATAQAISKDSVVTTIDEKEGHGYLDHAKEDAVRDEQLAAGKDGDDGEEHEGKVIDVILSDMSEPWDLLDGSRHRSLSNPYRRMINVSGNSSRDHMGSMVSAVLIPANVALSPS